jgi:hypothetical protein
MCSCVVGQGISGIAVSGSSGQDAGANIRLEEHELCLLAMVGGTHTSGQAPFQRSLKPLHAMAEAHKFELTGETASGSGTDPRIRNELSRCAMRTSSTAN